MGSDTQRRGGGENHARNVTETNVETLVVKQLMDAMDASGIFFGRDDASPTWLEIPLETRHGTQSLPSGPRRSIIDLRSVEGGGTISRPSSTLLPFDSRTGSGFVPDALALPALH